jgi:type VI protein secretion system component VasK
MDTRYALVERFFQLLVAPPKKQFYASNVFFFYKGANRAIIGTSLLLSFAFIGGLGLVLYSYQKIKADVEIAQNAAMEIKLERGNFAKEISRLRSLVTFRPEFWYRPIYGIELADQRLINLLDKKLLKDTKHYCVPYMMNLIRNQMSTQLKCENWQELLASFRIYLMLIGKELFNKSAVSEWFLESKDLLAEVLPLQGVEMSELLQSITPEMFAHMEGDYSLYESILEFMQSAAFSQSIYNHISEKLLAKPALEISKFAPKRLLCFLNPAIFTVKVPYLYTKEGYADFASHKKAITRAFLKIEHLNDVLDSEQIKKAIEETTENYKEAYEAILRNMWSKIQFKNSKDVEECLETFKAISEESPSLMHFIRRIEKSILIQNVTNLGIDYLNHNELLEQGKSKLEGLGAIMPEPFSSYVLMNQEAFKSAGERIQQNLVAFVQCAAGIVNGKNPHHTCYKLMIETPKEEFVIYQGLVLANTLPFPLGSMYKDLVENFNALLNKNSAIYVNTAWYRDIYSYYVANIQNKYPLHSLNYQNQLSIEDFTEFFAVGGRFDRFKKTYLESGKLVLASQAKKVIKYFEQIQSHWFGENTQLKVAFSITNVTISSMIKHVELHMLGQQIGINSSNLGPNEFVLTNKGPEIAKVEFLDNKKVSMSTVYAGPWSWYRLLALEDALGGSEPLRKVLKTSGGEMGFMVHFHSRFFPLSNQTINVPKAIVVSN